MKANGTVNGNSVTYTLETGTNVIHDTRLFDNQSLLATSRRGYLLSEGIQEGEKKKISGSIHFHSPAENPSLNIEVKIQKPLSPYAFMP